MQELISVIIPVYNIEKYLVKCIESIIEQTYSHIEILLIDDGSTDRSAIICDEFAKKDPRIQVVHQENGGLALARNVGIDISKGSILAFVDSDDYADKDMLAQMYGVLREKQCDCVVASFHNVDENGNELCLRTPDLSNYHRVSGKEAARLFLTTFNIEGFAWNKMFRKEIMVNHQIRYDETVKSFEDMYCSFCAFLVCNQVDFLNKQLYYYCQHSTSIVHTMNTKKLCEFRSVTEKIKRSASENNMKREGEYFYDNRMMLQLYDALKGKKSYSPQEWKKLKKEYRWTMVFDKGLVEIFIELISVPEKKKWKKALKLLWVWINYR